jgi:DNA-binding NarL/FixJ family response regulator
MLRTRQREYSLALIDIGLPDGDGLDVIKHLHHVDPNIPILAVTVMRSESKLFGAIEAGAIGYVLKDDHELAISEAINQVMVGSYPISPSLARYLVRLAQRNMPLANPVALTDQQLSVLQQVANGLTYQETADALGVSISTVRTHIQKLYRKLNAKSGSEAVAKAKSAGIM